MQRKFALLILGALLALVVPASAMGAMYPAEAKFEIAGSGSEAKPTLGTALGSCSVKITGTIPKAPANESSFEIAPPTAGTCTAGTTLAFAGKWVLSGSNYLLQAAGGVAGGDGVVLRYSSLPGCKLKVSGGVLSGVWSNGVTTPSLLKSGYHAHGTRGFTWENDGGSCALAGKTEAVSYSQETGVSPTLTGASSVVNNLTSASTPIIVK